MTIYIRRSRRLLRRRAQFYAVIVHPNGRTLWRTSETYFNRGDVHAAVHAVIAAARSPMRLIDQS